MYKIVFIGSGNGLARTKGIAEHTENNIHYILSPFCRFVVFGQSRFDPFPSGQ